VLELVNESVAKSDADIRKDLYSAIVVTGGATMATGFRERLERDLTDNVSKVHSSSGAG
jgi:actin-related protein